MDSKNAIKLLQNHGWQIVAQKGSHVQLKHPDKKGRVTVPHPKKDLPAGTLRNIEKQSGVSFSR